MIPDFFGVAKVFFYKKRQHWLTLAPGDTIDGQFSTKYIGDTYILKGNMDNHHYGIFHLKDPDYIMKLMSSYSGLTEYPSQKVSTHSFTNIAGEAKTAQFK